MKRIALILLSCFMAMGLCACGGDVKDVKREPAQSNLYSDDDIESAMNVAIKYFEDEFSGCQLTKITYAGDEKTKDYVDWAERNNADEVIVLSSSFYVDSSGGDGSLNPNSTYDHWMWILVRNNGGKWRHVDHGY